MKAARIASLFPPGVIVESGDPAQLDTPLHPEECVLLERVVEKRRLEIVAGRELARRALARLGIHGFALLRGEDRAPIWPAGVVGSITHTRGCCAVAVARRGELIGLGVDIERIRDMRPRLISMICTEDERDWIESEPEARHGALAAMLFSAKESVYKCQYPLAKRWLGFRDVRLSLDLGSLSLDLGSLSLELGKQAGEINGSFLASTCAELKPLWPPNTRFTGVLRTEGDFIATAAVLEQPT